MQSKQGIATDAADRLTELAFERTVLAVERTYAAWIRTGLGAVAAGLAAKKFLVGVVPEWLIVSTGSALALFGAFCFVAAIWREFTLRPAPMPDVPRLNSMLLIVATAILVMVALAAVFGVIFGAPAGIDPRA